jgi:hypothetical protein
MSLPVLVVFAGLGLGFWFYGSHPAGKPPKCRVSLLDKFAGRNLWAFTYEASNSSNEIY